MELWVLSAMGSAFFAGVCAVLAKCGVARCDSDVATAVRTTVVLVFAWVAAAVAVPDLGAALAGVSARSYVFLGLSGLATGASWICYFKALSCGDVNKVVPIDKSSTALSALLAIVLFGETGHLAVRLTCIAAILAGTFLMVERRDAAASAGAGEKDTAASAGAGDTGAAADAGEKPRRGWLAYAVAAALFAALTSVLAKVGVEHVDSSLATAVRTCVVLIMAWVIVAARGKLALLRTVNARELGFLIASGIATGASWLCYYHAIQTGQVSVVVQIDKLSILVSLAFGRAVFGERLSRRATLGLLAIVLGTAAMVLWA